MVKSSDMNFKAGTTLERGQRRNWKVKGETIHFQTGGFLEKELECYSKYLQLSGMGITEASFWSVVGSWVPFVKLGINSLVTLSQEGHRQGSTYHVVHRHFGILATGTAIPIYTG